jgi:UDP-N-acetylglucosamine:LPS N-acetylglucosamine transferase
MFGGHGSPAMETIARLLDDVQLVLMCGHNEELAARLRSMKAAAPRAVLGFTPQVRKYMQLGDFFIGKPGPGSLSEAIHLGLPVITFRNAWTMPQERYNTDWVREKRLGLVVESAKAVRPAALALIEAINDYQVSVRQLRNTAVFEVVDLIKLLLRSSSIKERPGASRARSA